MSSRSQVELYISRGVQTEDDSTLLQSPCRATQGPSFLSSDCMFAGELATPSLGLPSENLRTQILGALAYESAYTRPQASEYPDLLPLISSSYKTQKYAGLNGSRPSHTSAVSKRVVSLPDPSVQQAIVTERNIRTVSMPEFPRDSALNQRTVLHSNHANSSFSSDASHKSGESLDQRWHLRHDKMYPVDIPQTPSPPSSPDSVVIIGNEPYVSGSFLRRSNHDDDGWVTWASSPPRPIPALHGPLSLPYARCPSGAEGTVIEGDDLSHKIWGLGINESQNNVHTNNIGAQQSRQSVPPGVQTTVPRKTLPAELYLDPQQPAFQRPRDDVIDLSMPSTFYAGAQASSMSDRYTSLTHGGQLYFPAGSRGNQTIFPSEDTGMGHSILRLGTIERSANSHNLKPSSEMTDNSRNALNLPVSATYRGTGQLGGDTQNCLNKSAPIFTPGIVWNAKSAYMQQRGNDASALNSHYSQRAELLQQHHIELLTPPSTSSPRWSPAFSHPVDIELSKGLYDPKIYSPRTDLDDYSNKLMAMIQQIKHQDLIDSAKRYTVETTRQARAPMTQKGLTTSSANSYHQEQPQPKPASSNANVSSDIRRDLSQQHPRSIPLARLIQRRLSSVAEEDINTFSNSPSPMLPKVHPRVSLEPLIFRSPINRQEDEFATEKSASIPHSRPSADTMDEQTVDLESNAVVKLPRKCATHHALRTSSGPPSKRPPRHDIKKDKHNTGGLEDISTSAVAARKRKNGQSRKSEGKSGQEAPA